MKRTKKTKRPNRILAGARAALAYVEDNANAAEYAIHVPADIDVAAIRAALKLSQAEFSQAFGFNPASVKDWEQGRAKPTGPVRAYLKVIEKAPKAVQKALAAA